MGTLWVEMEAKNAMLFFSWRSAKSKFKIPV
jgi:hypothetical protein